MARFAVGLANFFHHRFSVNCDFIIVKIFGLTQTMLRVAR